MVKVMDQQAAVSDTELIGEGGTIEILEFEDSQDEAETLASMIQQWIDDEGLAPSEIAVLVSRQPELYADRLIAELVKRRVPFRNEQSLQDLSAEPAARLIIDFLTVVIGDRSPDAYGRLKSILSVTSLNEETTYEQRARWQRFLDDARERVRQGSLDASDPSSLQRISNEFLGFLGRESFAALSADYERGARLEEVISQTHDRIVELLQLDEDPVQALSRFSEDSAVRIMTIHKSKGLEFDTVVVLGIEKQTFWGKEIEERSAFFVGISRAKRRLWLTVTEYREKPEGFTRRWDEERSPHQEFLTYAAAAF